MDWGITCFNGETIGASFIISFFLWWRGPGIVVVYGQVFKVYLE
jgi:hypothetical protein